MVPNFGESIEAAKEWMRSKQPQTRRLVYDLAYVLIAAAAFTVGVIFAQ